MKSLINQTKTILIITFILLITSLIIPSNTKAQQFLDDPLPDIPQGNIQVQLTPFITVPASDNDNPKAKLTTMTSSYDGTGRLFVNDQRGPLHIIQNGNITQYFNLKDRIGPPFYTTAGKNSGFGYFTFHPDFKNNGKFYTVHTETGNNLPDPDYEGNDRTVIHSVIIEWTSTNPSANTFSGSRRDILRVGLPTVIHGLQQISFNPHISSSHPDYGLLYISIGTGESNDADKIKDPNVAQQLNYLHGKILRIDPRGSNSTNGAYGIPPQNPYVNQSNALGEIWSMGFRNPHRFAWDPNGNQSQMYVGNIGQDRIESLYLSRAGDNHGWPIAEGGFQFHRVEKSRHAVSPLPSQYQNQFSLPAAQYDHEFDASRGSSFALVGGYVYRGTAIPDLNGHYIYGDMVSGRLFSSPISQLNPGLTNNIGPIQDLQILNQNGQNSNQ